jgi:hypothetical protein
MSGTAANGVDYDRLPGQVIIPAGQRKADILIVPKEDQHPDPIKTVILQLVPPPMITIYPPPAPPYIVGCPGRAGAMIVDSDRPRPTTSSLPDGCFHLRAEGADGSWFRVESSTNLAHWTPICTNQVVQGEIHFVDVEAQAAPARYYRALPESCPAP